MSKELRMWLGVLLIAVALFYQGGDNSPFTPTPDKLEKPEEAIVQLVDTLEPISNEIDANKLSGIFYTMSEKLEETELTSNLQVQYFLDFVGRKVMGDELMVTNNNVSSPKYPDFAPSAAKLIASVIGPQTEETPLTSEEKKKLARLLYGFSWKLYEPTQDEVFENYKSKTLAAIAEYNKEDDNPSPDDNVDCPCEGKGYIVHGDGHKTPCPCVADGGTCNCKGAAIGSSCNCGGNCSCGDGECKCSSKETVSVLESNSPFGFEIPNYANYSPQVGVIGMTVRYHLVAGAPGEHNPVPASFVDTLTINQQYWLHDYLHGYAVAPSGTTTTSRSRTVTRSDYNTYNYSNCPDGNCATPMRRGILRRWLRR